MSDQNVKAAQKYLNAMFGGHKDWVKLDEDGAGHHRRKPQNQIWDKRRIPHDRRMCNVFI